MVDPGATSREKTLLVCYKSVRTLHEVDIWYLPLGYLEGYEGELMKPLAHLLLAPHALKKPICMFIWQID